MPQDKLVYCTRGSQNTAIGSPSRSVWSQNTAREQHCTLLCFCAQERGVAPAHKQAYQAAASSSMTSLEDTCRLTDAVDDKLCLHKGQDNECHTNNSWPPTHLMGMPGQDWENIQQDSPGGLCVLSQQSDDGLVDEHSPTDISEGSVEVRFVLQQVNDQLGGAPQLA